MSVQEIEAGEPVEHQDEDEPTTVVSGIDPSDDESADDDDSQDPDDMDDTNDSGASAGTAVSDNGSTSEVATETLPTTGQSNDDDDKGFLRRTVTAVSAFGLAIGMGIGPAHAATESPQETSQEEDLTEQVEGEPVEEEVDPDEPDTFPLVVDAQFE